MRKIQTYTFQCRDHYLSRTLNSVAIKHLGLTHAVFIRTHQHIPIKTQTVQRDTIDGPSIRRALDRVFLQIERRKSRSQGQDVFQAPDRTAYPWHAYAVQENIKSY